MTKNKTMTKKTRNLTWKLEDLPSVDELAKLVDTKILTPEEAREIVLGDPESDKGKIKALEELVSFLQDTITELSKNKQTFIPIERTIYIDRTVRPYWDRYWLSTSKALSSNGVTFNATNSGTVTSTAQAYYASSGSQPVSMSSSSTKDAITLSVGKDKTVS